MKFMRLLAMTVCAVSYSSFAAPPAKIQLDPPTLVQASSTQNSITLNITGAAANGAPNGFVLQWKRPEDLEWTCDKSYSGLDAGQVRSIILETNSDNSCFTFSCGTDYMFRAFAQASNLHWKSGFSNTVNAWTSNCEGACVNGLGFWKNHPELWPVTELEWGNHTYDSAQLLQILQSPPKEGNGLLILAHHLIAAQLNAANGADVTLISDAIDEAKTLIGDLNPLTHSLNSSAIDAVKNLLESYNEGTIGPGQCPKVD